MGIAIERNCRKKEGVNKQKRTKNLKHCNNPIPCLHSEKDNKTRTRIFKNIFPFISKIHFKPH